MEGAPFGRYRLLEILGRGGMGEVWRAYDTETDRVVALKVLAPELAHDPVFEERFRREAYAAAGLNEPHVVPIHSFGEIDGRLYVDMRLVDSQDLLAMLASGPLPPARAAWIVEQVAAALDAAHRIGLVHRDVKPSNILVTDDDFAYLIDFGIARTVGDASLTGTGNAIGSWAYMAPERISAGVIDPRSDVYALACVLHECVTGQRPYPGDSFEQLAAAHMWTPPPRPSYLRTEVPGQLDEVIAAGMAKDPEQRYQSAKSFARAARDAITDHTPRSYRPPPPPPPTSAVPVEPQSRPVPPMTAPPPPPPTPPPTVATDPNAPAPEPSARGGLPTWVPYALAAAAVVVIGLAAALVYVMTDSPATSTPVAASTQPSTSVASSPAASTSVASSAAQSPQPIESPAPTAPPVPAGGGALVRDAVDIYDVPDGVGNVIGVLHPGRRVNLVEPCRDGWCHVVLPEMPGGTGWVWGDFLAF
jgi:serine/threonine protein kinase